MSAPIDHTPEHDHVFLGSDHDRNTRRVLAVIALTTVMMVAEIVAGTIYGSMALVADGWHMATHAAALLISALAYVFARRHAADRRFTFGTGKFGDLAGFSSAVILALVALLIGWESVVRLLAPVPIDFTQAMVVAAIGLGVNLVSALLLKADHHHGHGHDDHAHDHHHHGHDTNLRAAYLHVMADALTSVLAIAALLVGMLYGWTWLDPVTGVIGALVIARWSLGLIRDSGATLLDSAPGAADLPARIRAALEVDGDRIADLHVWQVGPGHMAAIVALASTTPQAPAFYKARLAGIGDLSHVTVEVNRAA